MERCIRALDKARAIADLRRALAAGDHALVSGALRGCYYRHPMFAGSLLAAAVRRRFAGGELRDITRFVARLRANHPGASPGFPAREAEAVIRGVLGEVSLLDHVDPADFSYPEIGIAVLARLFAEWQPGPAVVEDLFANAGDVLQQAMDMAPDLGRAEERWFAAGMDRSPFAVDHGAAATDGMKGRLG